MHDSLHTLLHEWEVKPAPAPNFRADVWRRIAERKRRLRTRVWSRTDDILGQPAWAAAVVAVMLTVGAIGGNAWREHKYLQERAAGFTAYVVAVNPVARAGTLP